MKCVSWDFSLEEGVGDWSTAGCVLDSVTNGRAVCKCGHATNVALLVVGETLLFGDSICVMLENIHLSTFIKL